MVGGDAVEQQQHLADVQRFRQVLGGARLQQPVDLLLAGVRVTNDNAFKVPLVQRTLAAVLADARSA